MDMKKVLGLIVTGVVCLVWCRKHNLRLLSDDDLKMGREEVRKEYCSASDESKAINLQRLLDVFDAEISRRAWKGSKEYEYPKCHDWYLESDD